MSGVAIWWVSVVSLVGAAALIYLIAALVLNGPRGFFFEVDGYFNRIALAIVLGAGIIDAGLLYAINVLN